MSTSTQQAALAEARAGERRKSSQAQAITILDKLLDGTYTYVPTQCPCGAANDTLLKETDRYGFPHNMVICEECAVVRANPRLSDESYSKFYNDDYRALNHLQVRDVYLSEWPDPDIYYQLQKDKGILVKSRLEDFQVALDPKTVVDYGSYVGGITAPWREQGIETWGIDIDQSAVEYATAKGMHMVSSIDELIAKGLKADLVIMQDIIEHLFDLRVELEKVSQIMVPYQSVLYVWTPGIFRHNPDNLWQIAHTFQFSCHTLEYIMGECGFVPVYCDEDILGIFRFIGKDQTALAKPKLWVEHIKDAAWHAEKRRMPPFRGYCKFTRKELYEHVQANLAHNKPDVAALIGQYSGNVVCIASGPSVDGETAEIHALVAQGAKVICIAKMYQWCLKHGIVPDFVISMDAMADQVEGLRERQPGSKYLFASVASSLLFDVVKDEPEVYVWDNRDDAELSRLRLNAGYRRVCVVNGGSSIGCALINMSVSLGFKDLHIFGLDCMIPSADYTHSKGTTGTNIVPLLLDVEIDGEMLKTSSSWLEFARQALDMLAAAKQNGSLNTVRFYGETSIMKMWDGKFLEPEVVDG